MSETSDRELLDAWRGGDNASGDELVGRYFEPICRFFRSKLGGEVEDLVQRTFLDLLEDHALITTPSFRSYVFRIARNRLYDHFRRGHRRPMELLGSQSVIELGARVSAEVASAETREVVLAALRTLPLDFQMTLELAYWEGLTGPEIASVLEVSPNTVRSRISRGRSMLKEALERQVKSPDLLRQSLHDIGVRVAKSDLP